MPKGYWIVHVTVDDPAAYEAYRQANAAPLARHGGRFLVRGGAQEVVEGTARARSVVIEFPSPEAARACWDDQQYVAARALRQGVSQADIVIVDGWDS